MPSHVEFTGPQNMLFSLAVVLDIFRTRSAALNSPESDNVLLALSFTPSSTSLTENQKGADGAIDPRRR